jgi:SNF2 family DNA or RNA helicase
MSRSSVTVTVDGDDILVSNPDLLSDRTARMYFLSILGASATQDGWRCPRRRVSVAALVVRINAFLETKGWKVTCVGIADEAVERDIQRRRSFERTRDAASALRDGNTTVQIARVRETLMNAGWDQSARKLLPHQEQAVVHALTAGNAANFSVPGAGKTAATLAVATAHLASKTIDLVLVVGPLACFSPWEKESRAALPGKMASRRVRGNAAQRRTTYSNVRAGELILTSYAAAAADKLALIELCRSFKVMLVIDESHRIKRFRGGTWAPALIEIAKYAKLKMILSGTPMPQSGRDLYSQLNVLWPAGELTGPRDDFATRVERDFESILRVVQPFVSRTPKAALGLAPYTLERHQVPIKGTQAEIYDLIESNFRQRIANAEGWRAKLDALKRGRPIRLLQAAANPDLLNRTDSYYNLPRVDPASVSLMDRLATYRSTDQPSKSIFALDLVKALADEGKKAVCWSNFVPNLDHFSELIRSAGIRCFQIDGRVATGDEPINDEARAAGITNPEDAETRERIIEDFLSISGPAVLVTNPASCSESISLHRTCHTAIYLDRTYDCALFLQSIDRIHRLGLPGGITVKVHVLLATLDGRTTIDHLVDASLSRKEATMLQLLEGAELSPLEQSDDPLETAEGSEEDLALLLRFLLGESV